MNCFWKALFNFNMLKVTSQNIIYIFRSFSILNWVKFHEYIQVPKIIKFQIIKSTPKMVWLGSASKEMHIQICFRSFGPFKWELWIKGNKQKRKERKQKKKEKSLNGPEPSRQQQAAAHLLLPLQLTGGARADAAHVSNSTSAPPPPLIPPPVAPSTCVLKKGGSSTPAPAAPEEP